ncbi:hypothetical protein LXL04_028303 [Taraxacum kok-saghyz]
MEIIPWRSRRTKSLLITKMKKRIPMISKKKRRIPMTTPAIPSTRSGNGVGLELEGRVCAQIRPGRQGEAVHVDLREIEVEHEEHESKKRKTTVSPPTQEDDDDFVKGGCASIKEKAYCHQQVDLSVLQRRGENCGAEEEFVADDSEFIATFLNVVNHAANQEATNEKRTRSVIMRDRQAAHHRLVRDYFAADCLYNDELFERRFRISKEIFLRISNTLEARYDFFKQKPDARGRMGFSTIQKCTVALRYLAYGVANDASDEYLKMSERTARECVEFFCGCVIDVFGKEYLRKPTRGTAPDMTFTVNGHEYKHGYYLCDGIYTNYATFVKAYSVPRTEKAKKFTERQESARKDVERAFGVLKQKWHVVKYASRIWKEDSMQTIIYACIILHNMMVEFKGRAICKYDENEAVDHGPNFIPGTIEFLTRVAEIENAETCQYLREDLAEHVYQNSVDDANETDERLVVNRGASYYGLVRKPGKPNQQRSPPPSFRSAYGRDRTHSFPGNPTTAGKTCGYITPARRFELWTSHWETKALTNWTSDHLFLICK